MPLTLPPGTLLATPPPSLNPLAGTRVTSFRFDLLANVYYPDTDEILVHEALIGTLLGVKPEGSVSWSYKASVKGGGSITVLDTGQDVDWLNVRIRPVARISHPDGQVQEFACGVFLPSAPVEKWTAEGRSWSVELLDKNSILDQDIVSDPATGAAITYSLPAGANVVSAVVGLIAGAGETNISIPNNSAALASPQTWDVGTTRLKIINDLLATINYFSLWADGEGRFRSSPYIPPSERTPVYLELAPFEGGDTSILSPEWKRDNDIYSIPNRFVAVTQGDEETEALVSTAVNMDPNSPFSQPSRRRWITQVETGVEAVDQVALDAYALRKIGAATSVTSTLEVKHPILPDLMVNRVVRFTNEGVDALCAVTDTEITFDPVALVSSKMYEVTGDEGETEGVGE